MSLQYSRDIKRLMRQQKRKRMVMQLRELAKHMAFAVALVAITYIWLTLG